MKKKCSCNLKEQIQSKLKLYQLNSSIQSNKYTLKEDIRMISQMLFQKIHIKYWVFILQSTIAILSMTLIRYKCSLMLLGQINSRANQISFRFMEVWMRALSIDKMKVILNNQKSASITILIKFSSAPIFSRIRSRKIQLMCLKHCW